MLTFTFAGSNMISNWKYSPDETNNNLFVILWNNIMFWNKLINYLLLLVLFILLNSIISELISFLIMIFILKCSFKQYIFFKI